MNEGQWQRKLIQLLELYGWLWYHTHDSRRSPSGFPDIVAVKGNRILYIELKQEGKYPTQDQKVWLAKLHAAGAEVSVWWPKDLPHAIRALGPRAEQLVLPVRYRAA